MHGSYGNHWIFTVGPLGGHVNFPYKTTLEKAEESRTWVNLFYKVVTFCSQLRKKVSQIVGLVSWQLPVMRQRILEGHTLPPIIMEVENHPKWKELILERPISTSMIMGGRVNSMRIGHCFLQKWPPTNEQLVDVEAHWKLPLKRCSHSDFARNSKPSCTNACKNWFFRLYLSKKGMDRPSQKEISSSNIHFQGRTCFRESSQKNAKLCSAGLVVFSVSRKSSASCWWSLVFDHLDEKHPQDAARLDPFCVGPKYLIPGD